MIYQFIHVATIPQLESSVLIMQVHKSLLVPPVLLYLAFFTPQGGVW